MYFYTVYAYTVSGYADYAGSLADCGHALRPVAGLSTIPYGEMSFRMMGTRQTHQERAGTAQERVRVQHHLIVTRAQRASTRVPEAYVSVH